MHLCFTNMHQGRRLLLYLFPLLRLSEEPIEDEQGSPYERKSDRTKCDPTAHVFNLRLDIKKLLVQC